MGYITGDDSMVGVIRIDIDRKGTCLRIASPTQTLYKHGGWPGRRMANDCTSRTLSSGAVRDGVPVRSSTMEESEYEIHLDSGKGKPSNEAPWPVLSFRAPYTVYPVHSTHKKREIEPIIVVMAGPE